MTTPDTIKPLTKTQARNLTNRIADTVGEVWVMLAEAHDRAAHTALGYPTWGEYVADEFGISRGQAFRLLNRARVTKALEVATGAPVEVSGRQAAVLRHDPEAAAARIADAVAKGNTAAAALAAVVSERTSKQGEGEQGQDGSSTLPGARRGAVSATEKADEAKPAAPEPTKQKHPAGEGEGPPPVAPSLGGPATQDGVRHMVAMVTTTGSAMIARCCTEESIQAAIRTLRGAMVDKSGSRDAAARAERDVVPNFKGKR